MASFVSREDAIYRWAQQHAQATGRPSAFLDSTAHYFEQERPRLLSPSSSSSSRRGLFSSGISRPRSLSSRTSSSSLNSTQSRGPAPVPSAPAAAAAIVVTAEELEEESEEAYEERRSIYDQRPVSRPQHAQQSGLSVSRKSSSRSSSSTSSSKTGASRRDYFNAMFGVK